MVPAEQFRRWSSSSMRWRSCVILLKRDTHFMPLIEGFSAAKRLRSTGVKRSKPQSGIAIYYFSSR